MYLKQASSNPVQSRTALLTLPFLCFWFWNGLNKTDKILKTPLMSITLTGAPVINASMCGEIQSLTELSMTVTGMLTETTVAFTVEQKRAT